jgi:hypothetical protein
MSRPGPHRRAPRLRSARRRSSASLLAAALSTALVFDPAVARAATAFETSPTRPSPFQEGLLSLQTRLLGPTELPWSTGSRGATREERDRIGPPTPRPPGAVVDALDGDEDLRAIRGVQVRRQWSCTRLVGDGLPVDAVTGTLPGALVAARLGLAARGLGAYALFGGGTFTVYEHAPAGARIDATASSRPLGFLGLGGEVRLMRSVLLAGEVSYGRLLFVDASEVPVAPDPTRSVRTAVAALRFEY